RFLQASISVMSRDPQALEAVTQHMPVVRHNLINLLNAQMLLVFEDPTGIELLRQLATQEVKQVLMREIGREGIEEVLFTNFVMQ
ncbi:MAG: flagellar basal body-associated FliL family protein, partial [Pseudohongiella sp.]|nr:flagellar basal body-associated FliL family protein [Pseudohongiella sp.]